MVNRILMPKGVSNFRKLIEYQDSANNGYLFVDKSQFIKAVYDHGSEVVLITRPRRFGKTLNLSMLRHFFAKEVEGWPTDKLFTDLKIAKDQKCFQAYQGKYPVIFLSFKDVREKNYKLAIEKIKLLISALYEEHRYLKDSAELSVEQKEKIQQFMNREVNRALLEYSIKELSQQLYRHYKQPPIILVDEYDTPIQEAYLHGYYNEFVQFIVNMLGAGLKDSGSFRKAILTGITRVSKESLFSGLNHIDCRC